MIQIEQIKKYFPPNLQNNVSAHKYMLKEYLQLLILEYLASSEYIRKLTFIGGTNLRLIKGIDRFSEDLDFDCCDLSADEFDEMSSKVLRFLRNSGWQAEKREKSTKFNF
jgi:predicted nucleotidyltransferase component of viral defense system